MLKPFGILGKNSICFDTPGGEGGGGGAAAPAATPGGEGAGGEAGGATIKTATPGGTPVSTPQDFNTMIPDDYKDKEWVKDIKDLPSLFKRTDSALEMLGKRPGGIPQDTATKEEWNAFNKSFGVPEKAEDYEFTPLEGDLKDRVNENFQKSMRGILHEAGVSKRQFGILEKGWNGLMGQMLKEQGEQAGLTDEQFDQLADKTFGDRREKAMSNGKALLAKYTPEALKDHLGTMSNEQLVIMASVLDGIAKDYISEDQLPGGAGAGVGPQSASEKQAEAVKLMNSESYKNQFHPDHDATVKKVNQLFGTDQ